MLIRSLASDAGACAIFAFLLAWNDYLVVLVFIKSSTAGDIVEAAKRQDAVLPELGNTEVFIAASLTRNGWHTQPFVPTQAREY